jgi:hypothetical protein
MDGKVVGGEYVGPNRYSVTLLADALDWYGKAIVPKTLRSAKNKRTYIEM